MSTVQLFSGVANVEIGRDGADPGQQQGVAAVGQDHDDVDDDQLGPPSIQGRRMAPTRT